MIRQALGAVFGVAAILYCVAPALADRTGSNATPPAAAARTLPSQQGPLGSESHLPVPRFVSLSSEGANGRRGPGTDQSVDWVYQQIGLPLQVTGESGPWRRVRDPGGVQTWMHVSNLDNRRTAFVRGANGRDSAMRNNPASSSGIRAHLAPGVVGALTGCNGDWRRIAVGLRTGWVQRSELWGADDCAGL